MLDRRRFVAVGLSSLIIMGACGPLGASPTSLDKDPLKGSSVSAAQGRILVVGDSLSAEYGLSQGSGWVKHIAKRLRKHDTGYQIHNSSISGDTTSGGVTRLPAELERIEPDIVIIELGSNDALRGLPLDMAKNNLAQMIEQSQATGAQVVLLGMQIPPNYGKPYADQFARLFSELANTYKTTLVPFLLDGFATRADMFLDDGIHPNETAQPVIADTVWEHLAPVLKP